MEFFDSIVERFFEWIGVEESHHEQKRLQEENLSLDAAVRDEYEHTRCRYLMNNSDVVVLCFASGPSIQTLNDCLVLRPEFFGV
jgi:hypothetical protein